MNKSGDFRPHVHYHVWENFTPINPTIPSRGDASLTSQDSVNQQFYEMPFGGKTCRTTYCYIAYRIWSLIDRYLLFAI